MVSAIQRCRKARGLSQQGLADKAGISRSAVTMIESGARNPTLFVCHALAMALETDLSKLVLDSEKAIVQTRRDSR